MNRPGKIYGDKKHKDADGKILALTFDPNLEHQLISAVTQQGDAITLNIPSETAMELNSAIASAWKSAMDKASQQVVLLCDARLRPALFNMIERTITRLPVVAYDEIVPGTNTEPIETISITETTGLITQPPAAVHS